MSMEKNEEPLIRACVMGWPVSHSLSPALHRFWLEHYGIAGSYTSMAIQPDHLRPAFNLLIERGFAGCNLTFPLKEHALSMMDEHDESCLMSGAVNTVVIRDGKLIGYNSDGFGFLESLKAAHPNWSGQHVVIVGTGGAARGIIASLRGAGSKNFALVNRTRDKAERIVKVFGIESMAEVYDWDNRDAALKDATLLINCTSLGMVDQPALKLDLALLPENAIVADIVYRPLQTALLKAAQAKGNPVLPGLGMLLHQGRLGFEFWFGRDPDITPKLYQYMAEQAA